jgi:5-methyltetrahydrofolate--homocysteine methyltransferase
MLEGAGFEVYDLGIDVPASRFIDKVKEVKADILAMSALLTITFPHMKEVIYGVRKADLDVKIIVGGAPLNENIAKRLGADAYGKDAIIGVEICKRLVSAGG